MRILARPLIGLFVLSCVNFCGAQGQVISEPDDATVCEGESTIFTCVLDSSISSDGVQWYRLLKDTGTTERLGGLKDFTVVSLPGADNFTTTLNITNAIKSYTGYYWVRSSSANVCNASLTVSAAPPALTVTITNNTESPSVVVQWDEVDDFLYTIYAVTWTSERDLNNVQIENVEEQPSYTITGLTLDTVYTITVTATNRCGSGPEYSTSVSISTVISEPDDVTVCEGEGTVFSCVLNGNISSDAVLWYRFLRSTGTTEIVNPSGEDVSFLTHTGNTLTSNLTITNAIKSYTGYYWVGTSSLTVCNVSLTVVKRPLVSTVSVMKIFESSVIVVQWDKVADVSNYTVNWTGDGTLSSHTQIDQSFTLNGLTLDRVYNISVTATNSLCTGPEFITSVLFSAVISEPDDVTVCEGEGTTFTCVLDGSVNSSDVQWYRLIEDIGITERVNQSSNIQFMTINNTLTSNLTITDVVKSYTGYYWVGLPFDNVCNVSLTVTTSPPALTVSIIENATDLSTFVQWNEVDDFLPTNYTVTWTSDRTTPVQSITPIEQSYTITGLILDTVYNISVFAANECGQGPAFMTSVLFSTVINEPDDDNVTTCEGEEAVFTCVLNSNIGNDVQWYRYVKDTGTTEIVDVNNIIFTHTGDTINSSLTITNARISHTGYYWVGTSSVNVCNVSLTVLTNSPALSVNIIENITELSVVVQWDEVDDSLSTSYTVTWTSDVTNSTQSHTLIEQSSYTITGLTLDTVYIITVTASNGCGAGPEYNTSVLLPTVASSTTSDISPTIIASINSTSFMSTENPSTTAVTTVVLDSTIDDSISVMMTSGTSTSAIMFRSTIVMSTNINSSSSALMIPSTTTADIPAMNTSATDVDATSVIGTGTATAEASASATFIITAVDSASTRIDITTTMSTAIATATTTTAVDVSVSIITTSSAVQSTSPSTTTSSSMATTTTSTSISETHAATRPPIVTMPTTNVLMSPTSTTSDSSPTDDEDDDDDEVLSIEYIVAAGAVVVIILIIIVIILICCIVMYRRKKGQAKFRKIHRHGTILSDDGSTTKESPTFLSAYGEEAFKSGTGTFHPSEKQADTASIKSDMVGNEDADSQPLNPPDAYDKLPPRKVSNEDLSSQPLHPPDTYDKLSPQKVNDPHKGASDGVQYMNLPNGANDGVQNAVAPSNDNRNDEHEQNIDSSINHAELQPLRPTDRNVYNWNMEWIDSISTAL